MSTKKLLKSSSSFYTLRDMGTYRITFLGAAGVGKSSIIRQFLYNQFEIKYTKTVEELHRAEYIINGVKLTLDILDTAGAYDFPAMRSLAIARSDAFVLVYSVNNSDSFREISFLMQAIWEERRIENVPIVVVGNKMDLMSSQRVIPKATAEGIACLEWNSSYIEVSAKRDENLVLIFKEILKISKIRFDISPAVKRRRQSLPVMKTKDSKNKEKKTFLQSCLDLLPRSKSI